jgi:hypothetical protein
MHSMVEEVWLETLRLKEQVLLMVCLTPCRHSQCLGSEIRPPRLQLLDQPLGVAVEH